VLVDRRHCCGARSVRGAGIASEHLGTILANKNELKPEIEKKELYIQVEYIMNFLVY